MRTAPLAALMLLSGCVYYNGVYNAKRLARSAERAESDGRTIEARDFWSQVVVKADSVVARHPASEYVPQVQLLKARALARMGQCAEAVPVLEQSLAVARDSAAIEAGTFELARCQASLGNVGEAAEVYGRIRQSRDPQRRHEAQYQYAHALVLAGRHQQALDALGGLDDPRVPYERMVALGGVGRLADARMLIDSAIARADTAAPWDSLLSVAGRSDPAATSALIDRLVAMPGPSAETKARWLLGDALRLAPVDSSRGDARLAQAALVGGPAPSAGMARLTRARISLARALSSAELAVVIDSLELLRNAAGPGLQAAALYDAAVLIRAATDSAAAKVPRADLALFLAAETARDALFLPVLARKLFQRIADEWPQSVYAPKALLALHVLNPEFTPDFQLLLQQRYPDSPYVAALRGENVPQLRILEDSMSAFAASANLVGVPRPGAAPGQPGSVAPGVRRPVEPQ